MLLKGLYFLFLKISKMFGQAVCLLFSFQLIIKIIFNYYNILFVVKDISMLINMYFKTVYLFTVSLSCQNSTETFAGAR